MVQGIVIIKKKPEEVEDDYEAYMQEVTAHDNDMAIVYSTKPLNETVYGEEAHEVVHRKLVNGPTAQQTVESKVGYRIMYCEHCNVMYRTEPAGYL